MDDNGGNSETADTISTAQDASPPAPGTIVADGVSLDANAPEGDWSPARLEADTGIALDGDYPANHRLRAERLSREGKASDPGGVVSDDLIEATGTRLAGEDAARDAQFPPLAGMARAELETTAEAHGVDLSTASTNAERVELIEAARTAGTAKPIA